MSKYFDAHSHLNFPDYGDELPAVISRMKEAGVSTVTIGTDLKSSQRAIELAEEHEEIFACIGIHPVDDPGTLFDEKDFEKLVSHPKVVAVGECGLDYFRIDALDEDEKKRQKDLFEKQIQFALTHNKPLIIHSRSAYDDLAEILVAYKKENESLRGDMHFFAGTVEQAKKFLDIDFTISFAGPITFARQYDEVIRYIPNNLILSETDSPFAAPLPYRGKRNEPSYVVEIAKKIAEIKGQNIEFFGPILVENAKRLFSLTY
jgi:TatD DNase family protein